MEVHDSAPKQRIRSHKKKYLNHSDYWVPVALSMVSGQKENLLTALAYCVFKGVREKKT